MKKLLLILPALLMLTAGCGESGISNEWKCISHTDGWVVYENDSALLYIPNGRHHTPYIEKKCWCGKEESK